jgi:hypothetical protein
MGRRVRRMVSRMLRRERNHQWDASAACMASRSPGSTKLLSAIACLTSAGACRVPPLDGSFLGSRGDNGRAQSNVHSTPEEKDLRSHRALPAPGYVSSACIP